MARIPLQPPIAPMLAKLARDLPTPPGYAYEPKWDGSAALVFVVSDVRSRLDERGDLFAPVATMKQRCPISICTCNNHRS